MGIEPTLSHLRCDALPIELSSPLGARWWEGRYTSASSWCPLHQKKLSLTALYYPSATQQEEVLEELYDLCNCWYSSFVATSSLSSAVYL